MVASLRSLALGALERMYRAPEGGFAFRLRRSNGQDILEGLSDRYTAIVLIGLATEEDSVSTRVLAGEEIGSVGRRLLKRAEGFANLGDIALSLWAAEMLRLESNDALVGRVENLHPLEEPHPTVELAWSLAALSLHLRRSDRARRLASGLAERLRSSMDGHSCLFAHWPHDAPGPFLRAHVACFADLVYPIQALALYHVATGDRPALEDASRCAQRMCELQAADGQWWWHYDVRTGRIVEGYPVYAVHQDAMAPMALRTLHQAGGPAHDGAIERGLHWLDSPSEPCESLVDESAGVIWRKVARHEPGKLVRSMQAAASRLNRHIRVPGLDRLFPPGAVDYECRPYHLGWLLFAWSNRLLG